MKKLKKKIDIKKVKLQSKQTVSSFAYDQDFRSLMERAIKVYNANNIAQLNKSQFLINAGTRLAKEILKQYKS